jgi:HEAT repeat protein
MSEHPDDIQEPEGNRQGRASRVIFWLIVAVLLSGFLTWNFVPSVRVLGYQAILIVGPKDARIWSVKKLEGYKELAVRPFVIALKDEDVYVRSDAAIALGRIGPAAEKAVPALIEAFKDKGVMVLRPSPPGTASYALGKIGPKAVPALIRALRDKNDDVRLWAAITLRTGGSRAEKVVPALIEALKDKNKFVRYSAANALEEIGPKAEKAVPALIEALKDKDSDVRKAAKEALKKIQKK